jgi:hypothetical protein
LWHSDAHATYAFGICREAVHNSEQHDKGVGWKDQWMPSALAGFEKSATLSRREMMFLVEEKIARNGHAQIYMRSDGLFEGHIYRSPSDAGSQARSQNEPFEVCGVTETLSRLETIVDEELGL